LGRAGRQSERKDQHGQETDIPQYDAPTGLGRPANHAADFGNGAADEVRILGRVLSGQQIRGLAVNGAGPNGKNAEGPGPADGAVRALVPLLAWIPGEPALFEDVCGRLTVRSRRGHCRKAATAADPDPKAVNGGVCTDRKIPLSNIAIVNLAWVRKLRPRAGETTALSPLREAEAASTSRISALQNPNRK
jgi:hypothetical protein